MGPDHCAAMVTLGGLSGQRRRQVLQTAARFALGHTFVLGTLAALCLFLGVGLSEAFERWAEIGGGALLIGLALAALLYPGALRHGHPMLGTHGHDHVHRRLPLAAGALMALSGARALLLALPPLLLGERFSLSAWTYLPGFALGVLLGMGAVGLVVAEGMTRFGERTLVWIQRAAVASSGALGVVWVVTRL